MRISGHDCQRPNYKIKCHLIFWPKVSKLITLLNALYFDVGVQGTCKYGTRVDYILTSPNSPLFLDHIQCFHPKGLLIITE